MTDEQLETVCATLSRLKDLIDQNGAAQTEFAGSDAAVDRIEARVLAQLELIDTVIGLLYANREDL